MNTNQVAQVPDMNSKTSKKKPAGKVYESIVTYCPYGWNEDSRSLGFFTTWHGAMKNGDDWAFERMGNFRYSGEVWKFSAKEHTVYG